MQRLTRHIFPAVTTRRAGVLCLLALALAGAVAAPANAALAPDARYTLANGCYSLQAVGGGLVAKAAGTGYTALGSRPEVAEAFRMKATALGSYMLYGPDGDFLSGSGDRAVPATTPTEATDWRVDVDGNAYRLELPAQNKALARDDDGALVLVDPASAGAAGLFTFPAATDCLTFPEVETNVTGEPSKGATFFGETRGLLDAHMHMMAFEFLGGRAHCARPWHRWGVTVALVDCPDHYPGGEGAALENAISYGNPARTHDPIGWPTFRDWPAAKSLTHEQSYYKWTERAWRGGLRLYVNLLVDNAVLCELYPYKQNSCNEMDGVRLQARRIHELQDYIDAQSGGPGKGWLRIVKTPFEARRVINQGKLAVVLGIEVSKLFDCGEFNDQPECDAAAIDRNLDAVHALGVRDMELVNKFDNALSGVAGDSGSTGTVVNTGNKYETGHYWDMNTCHDHTHPGAHDRNQTSAPGGDRDQLVGGLLGAFMPGGGIAPLYPDPPHCNSRGLTPLGEHLVRRMIAKKMIIDPDHMSVRARDQLLNIAEGERYSGLVSSHSWSTPESLPRIYKLGGVITPYAGSSTSFVQQWREIKPMHQDPRFYFGFGWGADMNGFGAQGEPRGADAPNPVTYPFKSFDGRQTIDKQKSGERVYDINADGVAHYGLYPDWIEDLRKLAGNEIVDDMARGPESYLQMWERADGVPAQRCVQSRVTFSRTGFTRMRLGDSTERLLRRAGQPASRPGHAWSYCSGRGDGGTVTPILTDAGKVAVIVSSARFHRAAGIGPGARASRLRGRARAFGSGVFVRSAGGGTRYVYVVKRGRVQHVGVASRSAARTPAALRAHLRRAKL
jgi:microsomal dipeptidase-like Zn-dependent dipeptidase